VYKSAQFGGNSAVAPPTTSKIHPKIGLYNTFVLRVTNPRITSAVDHTAAFIFDSSQKLTILAICDLSGSRLSSALDPDTFWHRRNILYIGFRHNLDTGNAMGSMEMVVV
jgi:hypothetical protein